LAGVVQEEQFYTWTQGEVDEVHNDTNGDVRSNRLKVYTKHGVRYKPSNDPLVRTGTLNPLQSSLPPPATRDTQQVELQPAPAAALRPTDVAKQISEIAKIITDEQKYDGTNGSFDHKYTIFLDIC
jgi:hypothetical protein